MSSEIEHLPTFTQDILDIWETRVRSNPIAHSICSDTILAASLPYGWICLGCSDLNKPGYLIP